MRATRAIVIILVILVIAASMSCGILCPSGSTWSCQCQNIRGEYMGDASGDGCGCNCPAGQRVVKCNVYSPVEPQIYPRPQVGE